MEVYQSKKTAAEMEYALGAIPSIGENNHWFIGDVDTGISAEGLSPHVGENGNWWVGETDTGVFATGIKVEGAQVGQTIVVKAVDENGKPTEWETAELPPEWEVIADITTEEEVTTLVVDSDTEGNPFELQEVEISIVTSALPKRCTWWFGNGGKSDSMYLDAHSFRIIIRHNCINRGATLVLHDTWGYTNCNVFYQWENACTRFKMTNDEGCTLPVGTKVKIVGRRKKA